MPAPEKRIGAADLAKYYHLALHDVAKHFGVCATVFKRICRRCGIKRWPYRKIKSLEKSIETLSDTLSNFTSNADRERLRAEIEQLRRTRDTILQNPNYVADQDDVMWHREDSTGFAQLSGGSRAGASESLSNPSVKSNELTATNYPLANWTYDVDICDGSSASYPPFIRSDPSFTPSSSPVVASVEAQWAPDRSSGSLVSTDWEFEVPPANLSHLLQSPQAPDVPPMTEPIFQAPSFPKSTTPLPTSWLGRLSPHPDTNMIRSESGAVTHGVATSCEPPAASVLYSLPIPHQGAYNSSGQEGGQVGHENGLNGWSTDMPISHSNHSASDGHTPNNVPPCAQPIGSVSPTPSTQLPSCSQGYSSLSAQYAHRHVSPEPLQAEMPETLYNRLPNDHHEFQLSSLQRSVNQMNRMAQFSSYDTSMGSSAYDVGQ